MATKLGKIFLVEDDPTLIDMYTVKFKDEGYDVIEARDARTGLTQAQTKKPDLILLDLIMPVKDGFETLKELKANPDFKDIKVVVSSNLGQDEDIKKAKSLGATDYLVKAHFSFAEIIKKIHEIVG